MSITKKTKADKLSGTSESSIPGSFSGLLVQSTSPFSVRVLRHALTQLLRWSLRKGTGLAQRAPTTKPTWQWYNIQLIICNMKRQRNLHLEEIHFPTSTTVIMSSFFESCLTLQHQHHCQHRCQHHCQHCSSSKLKATITKSLFASISFLARNHSNKANSTSTQHLHDHRFMHHFVTWLNTSCFHWFETKKSKSLTF